MLPRPAMGSESEPPVSWMTAGLAPAQEPSPALAHRPDYRFVRALLMLQRRSATGTLRVDANGVLTLVRLRDGHPVFVEGGLPADSLGRLLVRRGRISETTLAEVEEERMLTQGRARFGEVAVRLGVLTQVELEAALREQVSTKLGRCLHWEHTSHVFIPDDHDAPPLPGTPLAVERIVRDGIARHYALERASTMLDAGRDAPATLRAQLGPVAARFGLDERQVDKLRAALLAPTIGDVLRTSQEPDREIVFLLAALAVTDQLVLPEPEPPEESGPFVIDDLPRTPRSRRPSSRTRGLPAEPLSDGATAADDSPGGAEGELPGREKLLADTAYLQGKQLLRAGEYGAAADAFREASNLRPRALEYTLCAAWSAYLSAGRADKWRDMLVELCERTLAQDRHLAFAHHVRGQLACEAKDYRTAQEALTRAVELDPDDDEGRRLLARLAN